MPRISMLIPEGILELIDSVSENRTAFMIEAAVARAKQRRRELEDAEIERCCREDADLDIELAREFEGTLLDGLE